MANPIIKLKRSAVEGRRPTAANVPLGELAYNTYDGYLYASKNVGLGTTVITVNPWKVGEGDTSYDINFSLGNVGIGSLFPTEKLDLVGNLKLTGNVTASGIVSATAFYGDGSTLSGITTAATAENAENATNAENAQTAQVANSLADGTDINVGIVSASSFSGDGSSLTGVTAESLADGTDVNAGVVTATSFSGDGSDLTGVTADGITDGTDINVGVVTVSGDATFVGLVTIGTNTVTIDGANSILRVGSTVTLSETDGVETNNVNATGIITASSFSGDGSDLTGVTADSITDGNDINVGIVTATNISVSGNAVIAGILTVGSSSVTIDGDNNELKVGTALTLSHTNGVFIGQANLHSQGLSLGTGNIQSHNLNSSGVITATSFTGSGANLTSLSGSNISSGTVSAARVGNLPASKITTGTFDAARIPTLGADKIGTGTIDVARIPDLGADKITSGTIDVARIPDLGASKITSGTLATARIPDLDAGKITSGTFGAARIPTLDATKIDTGTFDALRIPDLDAGKITTGTFGAARIPNLDAGKITTGTFDAARIPTLGADKIGTGTIDAARIPDLGAGKITSGTLDAARIPNLGASKITSGTLDEARIPDLGASKITSGTIDSARIPTLNQDTTGDAGGLSGTPDITVRNIIANNVSIAQTLTYEDVNNVDSIGIVTARSGIKVLSNGIDAVGVVTASGGFDGNITGNITGRLHGDVYYDDGSGYVLVSGSGIGQTSQLYNTNLYNSQGQLLTDMTAGKEYFAGTAGGLHNSPHITVSNVTAGIVTASRLAGDLYYKDASGYVLVVGSGIGQTSQLYNTNLYNSQGQLLTNMTAGQEYFAGTAGGLHGTPDINVGVVSASSYTGDGSALTGVVTSVTLQEGANVNILEVSSGNFIITATTSGGGIFSVVEDTTPQLGGNSDLNGNDIEGTGNINVTGDFTLTDTDTESSAGPELKLYRNSASPANADYLGQIKFAGESDTGVERNYAKITGKIGDASNGTEDGIIEFAHIKAGVQNISGRWTSTQLNLLNGTSLSVAGSVTAPSFDGDFYGDIWTHDGQYRVLTVGAGAGTTATLHANLLNANGNPILSVDGADAHFNGDVDGNIIGDVTGNVTGIVTGALYGDVYTTDGQYRVLTVGAGAGTTATLHANLLNANGNPILSVDGADAHFNGDVDGTLRGNVFSNSGISTFTNVNVAGALTATSYSGDGSTLSGIVTSVLAGTNIIVTESNGSVTINATGGGSGGGGGTEIGISSDGVNQGTVAILNFGSNLQVSPVSGGIATITGQSARRVKTTFTAQEGQDTFPVEYSPSVENGKYIDVYLNGSKLDVSEFTATNGADVVLEVPAVVNDVIEMVAFNEIVVSEISIINDIDPKLGADMNLNGSDIFGIGNFNITGVSTFSGQVTAAGFRSPTGNSTQFFRADGSISSALPSAQLTGDLPSISGAALTSIVGNTPAGNYGSQTLIPQIIVDSTGRITSIANTSFGDLPAPNLTGALPAIDASNLLNITGVATAATYGAFNIVPKITVDSTGRITGISTVYTDAGTATRRNTLRYVAADGDTTFSAVYTAPHVDVFQNGVKLDPNAYTATNGSSIVLNTGASGGDIIQITAYETVGIADFDQTTRRVKSRFTPTAGTTTFSVTYHPGSTNGQFIDVFVNGVKLETNEYTASTGSTVVLNSPTVSNDIVSFIAYESIGISDYDKQTRREKSYVIATAGQTTFNTTYNASSTNGKWIDVYLNGSRLDTSEYTATDGQTVVLTTGAVVNDVIEFVSYKTVGLSSPEFDMDIEVTAPSKGLILTSPNGTRYRLTVDNSGNLSTSAV